VEVLAGFLIAVAIAVTGVGGGVLTAPVLLIFVGLPAAQSVGTALLFVSVIKAVAVLIYARRKKIDYPALRQMLVGGIPGVVAGTLVLQRASARGLNDLVLGIVGLTIVLMGVINLLAIRSAAGGSGADRRALLSASCAGIGLEVGFSSAGAGALGTLALFRFTRLAAAEVVGTDLLFGFIISALGGSAHLFSGTYDGQVLLKLIFGGLAGVFAGAQLAAFLPSRAVRLALLLVVIATGLQLCYRSLAPLVGMH
jgi:uncharacterized protein